MQVLGISQSSMLNFGSKGRIPQKNGATLRFEMKKNPNGKMTDILGDVMLKGKTIQKFKYSCQNEEEIAVALEKLCKNAQDEEAASYTVMECLIKNMDNLPVTIDFEV